MAVAYQNNEVSITVERVDSCESKVNVNGKNLIWISASEAESFIAELTKLLDKYRI